MVAQSRRAVRNWALWTLSVPAFAVVVLVDFAALGYGAEAFTELPSWHGLDVVAALTVSALIAVEGARRVENRRRRGGALHKDLAPAWMIAAAIILHPALAILVVVLLRIWWRIRAGKCIPYRWAFSTSVHVLAIGAAHTVFGWSRDLLGGSELALVAAMVATAITFVATDTLLCALAIALIIPGSSRQEMVGAADDLCIDATAAMFGCLLAGACLISPWFAFVAIPITLTAQRALLLGQLESEAQTDPKTSLTRVDWWRRQTEDMLRRSRTQREQMAVLLIDIDHFKQVNDRHGHLVGDEALRAVATILRSAIRAKDVIGRFGGEEFVILLQNTPEQATAGALERLRAAVQRHRFPQIGHATISVGWTRIRPQDAPSDAIGRADAALYYAKGSGRNQVLQHERLVAEGKLAPGAQRPAADIELF